MAYKNTIEKTPVQMSLCVMSPFTNVWYTTVIQQIIPKLSLYFYVVRAHFRLFV